MTTCPSDLLEASWLYANLGRARSRGGGRWAKLPQRRWFASHAAFYGAANADDAAAGWRRDREVGGWTERRRELRGGGEGGRKE